MLISYLWLQSYFQKPLPPARKVAGALTLHSFEVESLDKVGKDTIFEIDVLPNRAHDCLSHIGVAREVAVLLGLELELPSPFSQRSDLKTPPPPKADPPLAERSDLGPAGLKLEVTDEKLVPRATKQLVFDVKVGESPGWLKDRLASMGQKPINNIVDATNFVMFETGQPVHSFDFEKITPSLSRGDGQRKMIIRPAHDGEKITTLDGLERTLDSSMLVIADSEKALDIAGVKGGANSQITQQTKQVVLSACNFNPTSIRKTSRKLGLLTDASKRFEQGITPELAGAAMARLTALVLELTGGEASGEMLDFYPTPPAAKKIGLSVDKINKLLGTDLGEKEVASILDRFGWQYENNKNFLVNIPAERLDLELKEDLIEEIGRIYGYEKIKPTLPDRQAGLPEKSKPRQVNKILYYQNKVRQILTSLGFSEIYNYSLVKNGKIELANPLSLDKKFLRSDLEAGLEEKLDFNFKYADLLGLDKIKIFEFGKVFTARGEKLRFALGIAPARPTGGPIKKGELVEVIKELNKDFEIDLEGEEVGDRVAEFDFEEIIERLPDPQNLIETIPESPREVIYKPFSIYPFIVRDIALWVPKGTKSDEILSLILKNANTDLIVNSRLFDVFDREDKTSYAFRFIFQSPDRTLTDDEVNQIMERIYQAVASRGWQVR